MGMRLRTFTPMDFKHLSLNGLLVISFTLCVGVQESAATRVTIEQAVSTVYNRTRTLDSVKREAHIHVDMVAVNAGVNKF